MPAPSGLELVASGACEVDGWEDRDDITVVVRALGVSSGVAFFSRTCRKIASVTSRGTGVRLWVESKRCGLSWLF